ncbi:MAG: glycosyltransferase family 2 protein [Candidatus Glassbacteria bacterium]
MKRSEKVSVLVPSYNEEENIEELLKKFDEVFEKKELNAELILVDDGSTDDTYQRAMEQKESYPFLRVVRHRTNLGLTEALKTGFREATGDILVFYPADLQYSPMDMPLLLDKLSEGYDLVTGWKHGDYGLKGVISFFYNVLSRWLFSVEVHDLNSVKAFKRSVADEITLRKDWHRYFVVLAAELGFRISEVRIPLHPRKHGKSKFGILRIPIGILDLVSVKFQMLFMKKPMLLFGSIGLLLFLIGIVTGLYALYMRFVLMQGFRPLLYFVVLSILAGIAFFSFGFLLEVMMTMLEKLESLETERKRKRDE